MVSASIQKGQGNDNAVGLRPRIGQGPQEAFLSGIVVNHGPPNLLGRFFLHAAQAATDQGVTLEWPFLPPASRESDHTKGPGLARS